MTRILIADDDTSIRRLLRRLLEEHSGWQVCGEAINGQDAVMKVADLHPDAVILDLAMPQMNGLRAAEKIAAMYPFLPMLLLTVQEVSTELARAAQAIGFQGAVSKNSGSEVIEGLENLLQNRQFFKVTPDFPAR